MSNRERMERIMEVSFCAVLFSGIVFSIEWLTMIGILFVLAKGLVSVLDMVVYW